MIFFSQDKVESFNLYIIDKYVKRTIGRRIPHIEPGGGGTSISGGRGTWPQNLPPKFLLEPQILPQKYR